MKNQISTYIVVLFCLFSCNPLKDVNRSKVNEKLKFSDRSIITERTRGDIIVLPAPMTPKERPRDTTIVYKGKSGATATTRYDKNGNIDAQTIICPDSEIVRQMNVKGEYQLKTLEVEKKMNIELANVVGKWLSVILIPIGFFFAVVFYFK